MKTFYLAAVPEPSGCLTMNRCASILSMQQTNPSISRRLQEQPKAGWSELLPQ